MFRSQMGLRQEDAAQYLGVTRTMISYYESGEREIPVTSLNKLADLFGVELEVLLEENEVVTNTNLAFAFRGENFETEDIESIACFKRIAMNYLRMESIRDATV